MVVITITPFYVKGGTTFFHRLLYPLYHVISCRTTAIPAVFLFSQRYTNEKTEMPSIRRHLRFQFTIYAALLIVSTE